MPALHRRRLRRSARDSESHCGLSRSACRHSTKPRRPSLELFVTPQVALRARSPRLSVSRHVPRGRALLDWWSAGLFARLGQVRRILSDDTSSRSELRETMVRSRMSIPSSSGGRRAGVASQAVDKNLTDCARKGRPRAETAQRSRAIFRTKTTRLIVEGRGHCLLIGLRQSNASPPAPPPPGRRSR